MPDREKTDPKEIESLRYNYEQEIKRRNLLRAQILVSEGFTPGATVEQVENYLDSNDQFVTELISNPDYDLICRHLSFPLGSHDIKVDTIKDLEETFMLEYIIENKAFKGLSEPDPVVYRDVIAVARVEALIYRKFTGREPISEYTEETAVTLVPDFARYEIGIPNSIKRVLGVTESETSKRAWEAVFHGDTDEERETRRRQILGKEATREPSFDDRVKEMALEESDRRFLSSFDEVIPDIRRFAEHVLNAKEGKLPV